MFSECNTFYLKVLSAKVLISSPYFANQISCTQATSPRKAVVNGSVLLAAHALLTQAAVFCSVSFSRAYMHVLRCLILRELGQENGSNSAWEFTNVTKDI